TVIEADWRAGQRRRAFLMTRLWAPGQPPPLLVPPRPPAPTHHPPPAPARGGDRGIGGVSAGPPPARLRGAAGAPGEPRGRGCRGLDRRPGHVRAAPRRHAPERGHLAAPGAREEQFPAPAPPRGPIRALDERPHPAPRRARGRRRVVRGSRRGPALRPGPA